MSADLFRFSIFLTPAPEPFRRLSETIRDLARRLGTPVFEPHVTVYGGRCEDPAALLPLLSAADGIPPFSLKAREIGCTDEFFKCFFLAFDEHPLLRTIHDRVRGMDAADSGYVLMPHLSLVYGELPRSMKVELAKELPPEPEILFDEVKLVSPDDPERGWLDTMRWRTVGRKRLGG